MDLKAIADQTIPAPSKTSSFYKDGNTGDIVSAVLNMFYKNGHQLATFAPFLEGGSVTETCANVWAFVKANIAYKIDPPGVQWVKTPARIWTDKVCDCKGYAIFIAACLQGLGIRGAFRFVSFVKSDPDPTHVYVVVKEAGREIILDCVLGVFNTEHAYEHKHDYNMSKIFRLAGISGAADTITSPGMSLPFTNGGISKAALSAAILKERLEIEKEIYRRRAGNVAGIGNLLGAHDYYINQLSGYLSQPSRIAGVMDDMRQLPNVQELSQSDRQDTFLQVLLEYGIEKDNKSSQGAALIRMFDPNYGPIAIEEQAAYFFPDIKAVPGLDQRYAMLTQKMQAKGVDWKITRAHKTGFAGILQSAGKVLSTVAKVVTAPIRLLAKGILELTLPKAAPNFIYLFITDGRILMKLPPAVQQKREKQARKADFICNVIGMNREHFMGICRNGIMERVGMSPEDYIAGELKSLGIAGIGIIPFAAVSAVGSFLIDLIKKLASVFGKKDPDGDEDISAQSADWEGVTKPEDLAVQIHMQPKNTTALETLIKTADKASDAYNLVKDGIKKVEASFMPVTPVPTTVNPNTTIDTGTILIKPGGSDGTYVDGDGILRSKDGSVLPGVTVTSSPRTQPAPTPKDNTMLYVGLGVLAFLAFKKR